MNIKKDELKHAMLQNSIEEQKAEKVLEYLKQLQEELKGENEKQEYRYVGLIVSGEGYEGLPDTEKQILVVKIKAEEDHNLIVQRVHKVIQKHNTAKRTKKNPLSTLVDVFHNASKANLREESVHFVGDVPLLLIEVDNQIQIPATNDDDDQI